MARARDFADIVQELRELRWKVAFGLRIEPELWNIELLDKDGIASLIEKLCTLDDPLAGELTSAYLRLLAELQSEPPVPGEHELFLRYVRGEIGDRTVRYILDIDSFELIELCRRHGLPPVHGSVPRTADHG